MQRISLIAALSENRVIGIKNRLPWKLPDDWKNFKKVTKGKAFIMGRKSYEAEDALHSEKFNIILTKKDLSFLEGFLTAKSIQEALDLLKEEEEIFILGGGAVFEQTIAVANYMYLTHVHHTFKGDAYFPEIDWKKWKLVRSENHDTDEEHNYPFSMNEYERVSP